MLGMVQEFPMRPLVWRGLSTTSPRLVMETTGDCWARELTLSQPLLRGERYILQVIEKKLNLNLDPFWIFQIFFFLKRMFFTQVWIFEDLCHGFKGQCRDGWLQTGACAFRSKQPSYCWPPTHREPIWDWVPKLNQGSFTRPEFGTAGQEHSHRKQVSLPTIQRAIWFLKRPHAQLSHNYIFAQVPGSLPSPVFGSCFSFFEWHIYIS